MKWLRLLLILVVAAVAGVTTATPQTQDSPEYSCTALPDRDALLKALMSARMQDNGGFNLDMWGTVVNRDGVVCAVVFTGKTRSDQWPGSRIISAQKAYTANAFSLPKLALSTAQLYSATQPGGSLFGLQDSNPINLTVAYGGFTKDFGTEHDPMLGGIIGGVNVFGGGLALYDADGTLLGALGVSGDSSCADHNIAWRTRDLLKLDDVPGGVSPTKDDNIVYDLKANATGQMVSAGGWGHPECAPASTTIGNALPTSNPIGG